jgi:aminoglycoside N3'-acetyltransferase
MSLLPFDTVLSQIDIQSVLQTTQKLTDTERPQCFRNYRASSLLAESLLREAGLSNVERIVLPADGKTTYLDRTSPMAWDAISATLTIKQSPVAFSDPVIASYQRHPFHLMKGSPATPPEGITTRLMTEDQAFSGADVQGAMVLLDPTVFAAPSTLRALTDLGALGFVSDYLVGRYDTPDAIPWVTTHTGGINWHIQAQDPPRIGFAVSPRIGDQLRNALRKGPITIHVHSDTRLYEGEIDIVTATVPGQYPSEVWILAHLYEPLPDDNSGGVAGAIEIAKTIKRLIASGAIPQPRFTLRLVFAMEMYGYAAYAHLRGVPLRDRVLGAMNLDAMPVLTSSILMLAPPSTPFFGDLMLLNLVDQYADSPTPRPLKINLQKTPHYADDLFLNDPMSDLPSAWLLGAYKWWHNSQQALSDMKPDILACHLAFHATWAARVMTLGDAQEKPVLDAALQTAQSHLHAEAKRIADLLSQNDDHSLHAARNITTWMQWRLARESARIQDFSRIWPHADFTPYLSKLTQLSGSLTADLLAKAPATQTTPKSDFIRDAWAASIIPTRIFPCSAHDQAKVPFNQRIELPEHGIYGPFATVVAAFDGKRTLKQAFDYAQWVHSQTFSSGTLKKYISAIEHLARHGYFSLTHTQAVTKSDFLTALRTVGIQPGDLILAHTSLSAFGHIENGPDTVIDALLEAVGPTGTLLLPTFTQSAVYCDGDWYVTKTFRPFDRSSPRTWTGKINSVFLQRPGVLRSAHPTHSVAGRGPLAAACLNDHLETDSPTGIKSPFGKLLSHHGKMLWLGADLASTTFLHLLEDQANLPYLKPALCKVCRPNNTIDDITVPKWLPGHREFYRSHGETTAIYRAMLAQGLTIRSTTLNSGQGQFPAQGQIHAIDAAQMHALGTKAVQQDPKILLCDSPTCLFCHKYRS